MKVEYIRPFADAAKSILEEVLPGVNITRGQLALKQSPVETLGVASVIGIAGEVKGRVFYDMSRETAVKIASTMNMEELPGFDALVRSTINEVANMISGRAISLLNDSGYKVDITPPSLFSGTELCVHDGAAMEMLMIPLELDNYGTVKVNVAVKEND